MQFALQLAVTSVISPCQINLLFNRPNWSYVWQFTNDDYDSQRGGLTFIITSQVANPNSENMM